MLVLDASAAVELLLDTRRGRLVGRHLVKEEAVAPELLDVEVCSALARLQRSGLLTGPEADALVGELTELPVQRIPHEPLLRTAWSLRERVRLADAFYVACAPLVHAAVLTCDARLARAPLPGIRVTVVP